MAQGISHALGVDLMENFDRPYAARSFRDFWRRWHISLSTWFRDYVYVPLGGNRKGESRQRVNIVVTMLLSGLWHGAGWTFLLWGAMHGALMLLESVTRGFWRRAPAVLTVPLVWLAVFLAWVPFRAADFDAVVASYRALGHGGWAPPTFGFLFGAAIVLLTDIVRVPLAAPAPSAAPGWRAWIRPWRGALWPAAGVVTFLVAHVLWGAAEKAFIYSGSSVLHSALAGRAWVADFVRSVPGRRSTESLTPSDPHLPQHRRIGDAPLGPVEQNHKAAGSLRRV